MQTTFNYAFWNHKQSDNLWAYSEQAGFVNTVKIYLENGDIYQGSLIGGKRSGYGSLTEIAGPITYVYSGEWKEDRKHGQGTVNSQTSNPSEEYFYDGEWSQGLK